MTISGAKNLAKKLKIDFKELQGGYQYSFAQYRLTFYPFKAKKYHNNITGKWANYKSGSDESIIKHHLENKPNIVKAKTTNVIELTDKGTQACIEHVQLKIDTMQRLGADKMVLVVLKALKDELYQYL